MNGIIATFTFLLTIISIFVGGICIVNGKLVSVLFAIAPVLGAALTISILAMTGIIRLVP